jgi:2-polyprenyl-6-methoxyphenol hydroxylase-like FAD-dependent oxidoreductase
MRVLVAGAGLGGLCLAHGLRQSGIDVQIIERRPTPTDQPSSYGIHLNADGLAALHACLPAENWNQLSNAAVPARDIVRFLDEQLKVLAVRDHEPAEGQVDPITRRRAISRDALRDALLLGLNPETHADTDIIQWGKQFESYEHAPDGQVRVHCADGSAYVADLLIGADGSNSKIRQQRLPGLERQDLGILNIAGRVPLTAAIANSVPASLIDGAVNNVVPSTPGWMFVSTWHAGPAALDPKNKLPEYYVVWAWAADRAGYPANVEDLAPDQLQTLVSARIAGWSPALRQLVNETDPDTIGTVPLRTMPELPFWEPEAVTLLGDAIHNMTPMAGIGANTALRDADALRRALVNPDLPSITARVGSYETEMRDYANKALKLSTRNARGAAATARFPRLAFRTILRVTEALPPVKRKMFGREIGVLDRSSSD